jgi:hypothetical protein
MIAVMEPFVTVQKAVSDGLLNYGFLPPFGMVWGQIFDLDSLCNRSTVVLNGICGPCNVYVLTPERRQVD